MRPSASAAEQLVWDETTRAAAVDSRAIAATGGSDARDILPHIQRRPPACQVLVQAASEAETQQPAGTERGPRTRLVEQALCSGTAHLWWLGGLSGPDARAASGTTRVQDQRTHHEHFQVRRRAHGRAQHS